MSVGEQCHPGWVLEYPARATRWVKAATTFMVPKEEDAQIYPIWRGLGLHMMNWEAAVEYLPAQKPCEQ